MRDLKFRAWDGENMRYNVTGFEHGRDLGVMAGVFLNGDFYRIVAQVDDTGGVFVMQFTGLQDRDGVDIYEGDLLSHKYYSRPVMVEFRYGAFHAGDVSILDKSLRVIGNIHENPDLLK